ncbi:MAG: aminopeptidase P family protein, partial [Candidatus Neomarinimicrobiota bacterium]|nr:aminopeptidase P family protein [Candidatus Neomarinimicrobiota bacterium]
SAASCLITPKGQYFITDGRYIEQSKAQVKGFERFIDMSSHLSQIKDNKLNSNGFKLAFEGDHMSYALYENMISMFPNTKWENSSMILENLAAVKDEHELECIRTAVEVTDKVYEEILPMLRPGFTEKQVANTMVSKYREYAEGEAYSPIVATGPNGALPHAIPTDREFQNGDFIVIDAAAKYGGYHADMTRTPVVGEATGKHKEVYSVVKEAQQRGCDIAKAGVPCKEVDAATREYIGEMGYGEYYTHGTGHGLGLEIHTSPRFSPQSKQVLEVNNVMTIEPGIYLAGWGGVRIEDDVIIGKDDCEILNQTTKDLVVLN